MQARTAPALSTRTGTAAYVVPFAVFLVFLLLQRVPAWPAAVDPPLRLAVMSLTLVVFSRQVISFRANSLLASIALGAGVFLIWIAPDVLWPGYRNAALFQNPLTGTLQTHSLDPALLADPWMLGLRTIRAVLIVPIIEELFWRAWLMRWLINPHLERVPLGAFQLQAFLATAVLFASEHGPYWDVGLIAGLIYNGWMVRTRSLGDCILAHAVTNGCLCAYVIATQQWQYWL